MKEIEEHPCPHCKAKCSVGEENASLFSLLECWKCGGSYGMTFPYDGTNIVKFDQSRSQKLEGNRCVVDWSQTRDRELIFIAASRDQRDTGWRFTERSTWEVRWYEIHANPELIAIADTLSDFHLIKSGQSDSSN
jgi:hypothetical protein